jgi:flagellar protein FlaG
MQITGPSGVEQAVRPIESVQELRRAESRIPGSGEQAREGRPVSPAELDQAVERMNETMKTFEHALRFEVSKSHRIIIKVIDTNTGETIEQIPPEKLVRASEAVQETLGLLLDEKA